MPIKGFSGVEVAVIGGGQAGLSVSWQLARRGIDHVVLEAKTAGHEWSDRRWDTFCLVTPNWQCALPGFPYQGEDPHGFMLREQILDYLKGYVASTAPPLREGVRVRQLTSCSDGPGFDLGLFTDDGEETLAARQVVVATGPYQTPRIPRVAERLPAHVHQLHSSQYRNADGLPAGAVMVVGSGQSGAQIAEDLHLARRQVHLVTGSAPRCARFYRGRDVVAWLEDMGYYRRGIDQFDDEDAVRFRVNHYVTGRDGGRDIDLRAFAADGMRLYGRLVAIDGAALRFDGSLEDHLDHADAVSESINRSIDTHIEAHGIDAPAESGYQPVWLPPAQPVVELDTDTADIGTVIWATGFARDDRWINVPVFDGRGYPTHTRGVTSKDGLYFIGLPWQYTWGSGRFGGVADDAGFLADRIDEYATRLTSSGGAPSGLSWIAGSAPAHRRSA